MTIKHRVKLFFAKFRWTKDFKRKAADFAVQMGNYRFVRDKRKELYDRMLQLERERYPLDQIDALKEKVDLLDEILNHVHK